MLTLNTKEVEKKLDVKFIPFVQCLGIDTASRTGWCRAQSTPIGLWFFDELHGSSC